MKTILKRLNQLNDDDLLTLSEAIDVELEHRLELTSDVPDSARRRAVSRQHSYRRETARRRPFGPSVSAIFVAAGQLNSAAIVAA